MCDLRKDTRSWGVKEGLRCDLTMWVRWLSWVWVVGINVEEESGIGSGGGASGGAELSVGDTVRRGLGSTFDTNFPIFLFTSGLGSKFFSLL
mgnify:CR=1 FL=1